MTAPHVMKHPSPIYPSSMFSYPIGGTDRTRLSFAVQTVSTLLIKFNVLSSLQKDTTHVWIICMLTKLHLQDSAYTCVIFRSNLRRCSDENNGRNNFLIFLSENGANSLLMESRELVWKELAIHHWREQSTLYSSTDSESSVYTWSEVVLTANWLANETKLHWSYVVTSLPTPAHSKSRS